MPIFKVGPCESELSFIFHKKQYRSMPLRYLHGLAVLDTEWNKMLGQIKKSVWV